jgi:hypothetical protein
MDSRAFEPHWTEIMTWSNYQAQRSPSDAEGRSFYNESVQKIAPRRDDLITWFDLLYLDDYASFAGKSSLPLH